MVGVCCFGVVLFDFVYVVVGCYDGYWECELKEWDIVVGLLIVCEVGVFVEVFNEGDDILDSGLIICVNEFVFLVFVKVV